MNQILETIRSFDGVFELGPTRGDPYPEIAWGDRFFYYAPDGRVPHRTQPYATIITKNYPGDEMCDLDHPDRWRLNIHVGRSAFADLVGEDARSESSAEDLTLVDTVIPHPLYRAQGWVAIINSGARTQSLAGSLLLTAHHSARSRGRRP